jgi:hypothetical protein
MRVGLASAIGAAAALHASSGEVKVTVEQTPPAVQQTIQREHAPGVGLVKDDDFELARKP